MDLVWSSWNQYTHCPVNMITMNQAFLLGLGSLWFFLNLTMIFILVFTSCRIRDYQSEVCTPPWKITWISTM